MLNAEHWLCLLPPDFIQRPFRREYRQQIGDKTFDECHNQAQFNVIYRRCGNEIEHVVGLLALLMPNDS
jgi:hypothetical protein